MYRTQRSFTVSSDTNQYSYQEQGQNKARPRRIDPRQNITPLLCTPFPTAHPSTKLSSETVLKMTTSTPIRMCLASDSRVVIRTIVGEYSLLPYQSQLSSSNSASITVSATPCSSV